MIDSRAPFEPDVERLVGEIDGALDYLHGEQVAIGLGLASWHDQLAISIDVEP